MLKSKKSHKNWFVVSQQSQTDITNSHKNRSRLGNIIVDCLIITTTAALAFYQAVVIGIGTKRTARQKKRNVDEIFVLR